MPSVWREGLIAGTIYSGTYVNGIVLADPTTQRPATVTGSVSNKNGDAIYGKPVARWTVVNEGTIQSTGTAGYGIDLGARGTVENGVSGAVSALISGYGGVLIRGALTTVSNLGTIEGTGAKRDGVELKAGGYVGNGTAGVTTALIRAERHAVVIRNDAGAVRNFGTLTSTGTYNTVDLFAGGSVGNGSSISTKALISGSAGGVDVNGSAGTVTNFGTVEGYWGVGLRAGGRVTNGSTAATAALISGTRAGVEIAGATGTVTNFGTIQGTRGVDLAEGGTIRNFGAIKTLDPYPCVYIGGAAGTVTNFGTISTGGAAGDGVVLFHGGRVANGTAASPGALIGVSTFGIVIHGGAGTVTNFGTIKGYDGVILGAGGSVINGSTALTSALISSARAGAFSVGVYIGRAAGTVTNFGTISGGGSSGVAVRVVTGAAAKVVVEPGAVFIGTVLGGGNSTVDFETAGMADMSGVNGFKTITLGNGKSHTLTLTSKNFDTVVGAAITVDDGDSGNAVSAVTLPAADHIIVHAGAGLDTLTGGKGNDVFFAGGDTVMTGNAGRNKFVFSAPGGNTIGDFAVSATNEIVLSNTGFSLGLSGAGGTPQALPSDLFVENSDGHFTDASQRFAYATGNGDLSYSASGENGTPSLVAHFAGTLAPALAAAQLFFIT